MPRQISCFGRLVPRVGARRLSVILLALSLFAIFSMLFTIPAGIPQGPSLSQYADHKFSVEGIKDRIGSSILNPWRRPTHPPPRQENDNFEDISWWSDWKWIVPFSSSLTLDEDRSLLPPLPERPPIYCYYDDTLKKDGRTKDAESELLLTWRRAWWAQGFKPVILGPAEAMNNPMYNELQRNTELNEEMKTNLMRWLAWENMGVGILAQYTVLPMGHYDDPLLTFLRHGNYPKLTRFKTFDNAIFFGSQAEIAAAVKTVMEFKDDKSAKPKDFLDAVPRAQFHIEDVPKAIAYYSAAKVEKKYPKIAEGLGQDRPTGLRLLNELINSHLHLTWQNIFRSGVSVLKPLPEHTTHLVSNAVELAKHLVHCPLSPMPSSCPPNNQKCIPCVGTMTIPINTPGIYRNKSTLYTIGTVPHPHTLVVLEGMSSDVDVRWIRREMTKRDPWLTSITKELLGSGVGGSTRVVRFKSAVAAETGPFNSLWLTAGKEVPEDIAWHFGFVLPVNLTDDTSASPVPADRLRAQQEEGETVPDNGPTASPEDVEREKILLESVLARLESKTPADVRIVSAMESWNLADTEAWKFSRAFMKRRTLERLNWERLEARYTGGAGSEEGRSTLTRWKDKVEDTIDEITKSKGKA